MSCPKMCCCVGYVHWDYIAKQGKSDIVARLQNECIEWAAPGGGCPLAWHQRIGKQILHHSVTPT
jgi:hypothetical protein